MYPEKKLKKILNRILKWVEKNINNSGTMINDFHRTMHVKK